MKFNQTYSNPSAVLSTLITTIISAALLGTGIKANAGNTWTGGGATPNWSDINNWGGAAPTYGTLTFTTGGTQGTTSTNDSIVSMNILQWTGTSAWTVNQGGSTVLSLYDNSGAQPKIEQQSSGLVTLNAPITYAQNNTSPPNPFGEINAVSGNILFGNNATLTVNGVSCNGIKLWNTAGDNVTFSNTVSATGKWFGLTQNPSGSATIAGAFTSGDFYVMNGGTLNLSSNASFSTTGLRLGGDYGNTGNQVQTLGGTFNLTSATGGQTFSGIINSVSGNTSGALVVYSGNTAGTNTLNGASYLDSGLIVSNAAGGTLLFSAATAFDVKNQQLIFTPYGTIIVQGLLTNSLAGGTILVNGPGTLLLTNVNNQYTGTSSGSLNANGTQITNGATLGIWGDGSLGLAPAGAYNNIQFAGSGKLQDTANNITLATTRSISIASGATATLDSDGNTFTIGGLISGSGSLAKVGAGTLVLSGTNTYSGGTTLTGTIGISANTSVLGTGTLTIPASTSGTLAIQSSGNPAWNCTNATTIGSGGTLYFNSGYANITNSGVISGAGNIGTAGGPGTTILTGVNTYTGTTSVGDGSHNHIVIIGGAGQLGSGTYNTNIVISPAGANFTYGSSANQTIAGTISGIGSLTNSGTGTLTLTGTNTYTGATIISAGTLAIGGAGQLGSGSYAAAITNNGIFNFNSSAAQTLSGVVSGTGSLTDSGSGTLTFIATNTYTGGTKVSAGRLVISNVVAPPGTYTIASGATNEFMAATVNPLNTGAITFNGAGVLKLDGGANVIGLTVNNDTVALTNGLIWVTGNTTVTGSGSYHGLWNSNLGSLQVDTGSTINFVEAGSAGLAQFDALNGGGTISMGYSANTTLSIGNANGSGTFTGALNNGGSSPAFLWLTKNGTGTEILSGNSSYSGNTTINNGILEADSNTALGNGTVVLNGGVLSNNVSATLANTVSVNSASGIGVGSGQTLTLNGAVSGSGALTKTGAGVLILTGANTYSGQTTNNAGELDFLTSSASGSAVNITALAGATNGIIVTSNGGQWANTGSLTNQTSSMFHINYSSFSPSTTVAPMQVANLSLGSTLTLRVDGSPSVFFVGQNYPLVTWTGSGPANATGFSTLVLPVGVSGNLNVSGSTLFLNVTGNTSQLTWNTGNGNWDTATANWLSNGIAAKYVDATNAVIFDDAASASGNPVITLAASYSPVGVLMKSTSHNYFIAAGNAIAGSTSLILDPANTMTLTLSNANSYTGGTTIGGGILTIAGTGTLGSGSYAGAILDNGTLNLNSSTGQTLSGIISGTGVLNYSGTGGLTLSASNSYSGGTTIANSAINAKNGFCFGTGTVTVNASGQINNSYNPGISLTYTNALILNGGYLHTGGGQYATRNIFNGPVTLTASSSMSSDGGTLGNSFNGGVNMGNGGYTLTVNGNGPNDGYNANNFNSVISGGPNATFQVLSAGIAYLNAANTFSGTVRSGYSLVLQNGNALQNATLDMNAADSGSVTFSYPAVIGGLAGSRNLSLSGALSIGQGNASTNYSGNLTNSSSITKIGTGTLTLSGAINCTNGVIVSAGTLALSGSATIANANITVANGASFNVSGLTSTFALGSTQILSNSVPGAILNGTNNCSAGTLSLVYDGVTPAFILTNGTMTLSSSTVIKVNNTGASLAAGTRLLIAAAQTGNKGLVVGTLPSVTITGGGAAGAVSLKIDALGNLDLVVAGTVEEWVGASNTSWGTAGNWITGVIPGNGSNVVFDAQSTNNLATVLDTSYNLSSLSLYPSPTGPVSIGGTSTLTLTNGITMLSSGLNPNLTITAPVLLGAAQTWTVNGPDTLTVSNLSGGNALTVAGGGTVVLGGTNTTTGGTTISGGTLRFAGAGSTSIPATGSITVGNGATIDLNGLSQSSTPLVTLQGGSTLQNGTLTCNNGSEANNNQFTGTITNNGAFISNQRLLLANGVAGSLTLAGSGSMSFGGDNNGSMNYVSVSAFTSVLTINGGTLNFTNSTIGIGNGWLNVGANTTSANGSIVINGGSLNVGTWLKLGGVYNNTTGLSSTSSLTITNGNATVGGGNAGTNGILFMNGGNGDNTANTGSATLTLNSGGSLTVAQIQAGNQGTKTINLNGGTIVAGINASNLFMSAATGLTVNLQSGGGTINSGTNSITIAAVLGSTGGLTKAGTGTLTLTGNNTYANGTTITGGRLAITPANLTGGGPMTINDNGRLNLTMSASAGQMSLSTLTLGSSNGCTNEFALVASTTTPPIFASTLTLVGTNVINIISGGFTAGYIYPLIGYTTITGAGSIQIGAVPAGLVATITTNNISGVNTIALNVSAANTTVDVWSGNTSGNWDTTTSGNWTNSGVAVIYADNDNVRFDDSATAFTVTAASAANAYLSPGNIVVSNTAHAYTWGGIPIAIVGTMTKNGTSSLTVNTAEIGYGNIALDAGTILIGNAASLGWGTLTMANGTTLQMGTGGTTFPNNPIVVPAGASVSVNGGNLANGIGGSITSGDSTSVINITGSVSFSATTAQLNAFTGTVVVNSGQTLRFSNQSGSNGGSNTTFNVLGTLQPRNSGIPISLGALTGSGSLSGASTTAGTATYTIGAKNLSTTFLGAISDASTTDFTAITKVGTGTLTLSGANNYSGATTINAGSLMGVTGGSCSNSAVTVNTGATNGVVVNSVGAQWICTNLTYSTGTEYVLFTFNTNSASTSTAPLYVQNNLTISGTLNVVVGGDTLPLGTYPLMKYVNTLTGAPVLTPLALSQRNAGYITNDTANKQISLVITNVTTYSEPLVWQPGSGLWDSTTANWKDQLGVATSYSDLIDAVVFNETPAGSGPFIVTNSTSFSPVSVTVSNVTKQYTLTGGGIIGATALTKLGTGTLILLNSNSFTGGTTNNVGIIEADNNYALGGGLLTMSGGTLSNNVSATLTNAVNLSATSTIGVGSGQTLTLGGVITNNNSANSSLAINGLGTVTLTNLNNNITNIIGGGGNLTLALPGVAANPYVFSSANASNTLGALTISPGASVILAGATATSTNAFTGTFNIGSSSTGASATFTNGVFQFLNVGFSSGNSSIGTLNVQSNASISLSAGRYCAWTNVNINGGTLTFANSADRTEFGIQVLTNNIISITGGAIIDNDNHYGVRLGCDSGAGAGNNSVAVNQSGGGFYQISGNPFQLGGTNASTTNVYNLSGGALTNSSTITLGAATGGNNLTRFSLTGSGKLLTPGAIAGSQTTGTPQQIFDFSGGTLVAGIVTTTWLSSTNAPTTYGTLINNGGTLAPGDVGTAGKTTITGNYSANSASVLDIDLNGSSQATAFQTGGYDLVAISGTAALGGKLVVRTNGSFTVNSTTGFTILTTAANGLSGTFANMVLNQGSPRVTLTSSNGASFKVYYGTASVILTNYSALTAGFTESSNAIPFGNAVTLTDTSVGAITNWIWNFGDTTSQTNSTSVNPVHTYSSGGSFTPTLTVYSSDGATNLFTGTTIIVTAPLIWTGGTSYVWDTTTTNWSSSGSATVFTNAIPTIFNDTGAAGSPVALGITVQPSSLTFSNSSESYTISGAGNIGGTAAVTLAGLGKVTLLTTNSYSGGTTIGSASTLVIGDGSTASGQAGANTVTDNGTLVIDPVSAVVLTNTLTGNGTLVIANSTVTITNANPGFTGGTVVSNNATVSIAVDNNLGTGGGLTLNNGTLAASGSYTMNNRTVTLNSGGGTLTPAGTLTITNGVVGVGALTMNGAGTLVLAANNNYSGLTTVSGGTLQVANSGTVGTVPTNILLNGGNLTYSRTDNYTQSGTIAGSSASSAVKNSSTGGGNTNVLTFTDGSNLFSTINNASAGSLVLTGSVNSTNWLAGTGSGSGLVNSGSGTLWVNGGTYTLTNATLNSGGNGSGTMVINGGTVNASYVNGNNGGALAFPGNLVISNGNLNVTSGRLNFANDGQTLTIGGGALYFTNANYGLRLGEVGGNSVANDANSKNFTGVQNGGQVIIYAYGNTTGCEIGGLATNKIATYTLAGGSMSIYSGGVLGLGVATNGSSTTAFTLTNSAKLLVSGTIEGGAGNTNGSVAFFNYNGGTLVCGTYNATYLQDATGDPVGSLVNYGGTLAPGDVGTPGKTTIIGNYGINSGTLAIDIGGTTQASTFTNAANNYDFVSVSGTAALGGNLSVSLINGFTPSATNSFTILTSGGLSGSFTNLLAGNRLVLPGNTNYNFLVVTTATSVILTNYAQNMPVVATSPTTTNIIYGNSVLLTANASGLTPLGYQWFDNNTNLISGATNSTLLLTVPSVAASGNYTVIVTNTYGRATNLVSVTVMPASLSVTANNTNRIYGSGNPVFTASYSGFVNGETASVLGGSPSLTTSATSGSPVGLYTITAAIGSLSAANYSIVNFTNGTLTINGRFLAITASAQSKAYGTPLTLGTTAFTSSGLTNGDSVSSVTLSSAGATNTATVGSYTITVSNALGSGLTNYSISYNPGTLTVSQLAVVLTGTRAYDGTTNVQAANLYVTNTVNGDQVTVTNGPGGLASAYVGTNAITTFGTLSLSGGVGTNYTLAGASGYVVVTNTPLVITANNDSKTYDGTGYSGGNGVNYVGFVNGETNTDLSGSLTFGGSAQGATNAGTYNITPGGYSSTNYLISFVDGTLTVSQLDITVTADSSQSKLYGTADPTLTYTFTPALISPDTFTGFLSRAAGENVGSSYAITQGTLTAGTNYSISFVPANFTISTLPITITAQPNTKVYDGTTSATNVPTLTGMLATGDGFSSLTEAYSDATVGTGKTVIPTAVITNASGIATANYAITAVNDTGSVITPASAVTSLLLTNNVGVTNYYGQALVFTAVVQTNSVTVPDASSNVVFSLGSMPVWTNTVTGGVAYYTNTDLTVGVTNFTAQYLGDSNYLGSSVTVTQTVVPATPTLTLTASAITYGQTLTSSSLSGSVATNDYDLDAEVAGSFAFADNTITPNAGTTNVWVIFTPTDTTNYTTVSNTVNVTVGQASTTLQLVSSNPTNGYLSSVFFTATNLPPDATSNVVFEAGSVPFSTNNVAGGGTISISLMNLTRGTNLITAVYLGDNNYQSSMASLNQIVTNHPPLANTNVYSRGTFTTWQIAVSDLLTNASDVDGDTLTLVGVSTSTNGITLVVDTNTPARVQYYNTNHVNDQFTYTVTDGYGGTNSAVITLTASGGEVTGTSSITGITGTSVKVLTAYGIPGYTYITQRATNVNQVTWLNLATNTLVSPSVIISVTDSNPPSPSAYYRLLWSGH